MQGSVRLYTGASLGLLIFSFIISSILLLVLIDNQTASMMLEDSDKLKKTKAQKRKARASTSMPIRVKFSEPKPREAPIKLDSLDMVEATSEAAATILSH